MVCSGGNDHMSVSVDQSGARSGDRNYISYLHREI